jgi:ethanolaminephosphotransferase
MYVYPYITKRDMKALETYRYSCEDRSVIIAFFDPFWTWLETLVPYWIAPNVLTLAGLLCNYFAFLLLLFYSPTMTEFAPAWAHYLVAFLLFAYQTLDNIDGKHARRTKNGSVLGEIFDHGCDSASLFAFVWASGSAASLRPDCALGMQMLAGPVFFMAHWEEYFTGHLLLGTWNSPAEIQWVFISLQLATAFFGNGVWTGTWFGYEIRWVLTVLTALCTLFTMHEYYNNVRACPKRKVGMLSAFKQTTPLWLYEIAGVTWLLTTPLLWSHPAYFTILLGCTFSYIVCNLIIQRIFQMQTPLSYSCNWIMLAAAAHSALGSPFVDPALICVAYTIYSVALLLYFAYCVFHILCTELKIKPFSPK